MTIRNAVLVVAMLVALAAHAAAEPTLLWELDGLKMPESVVVDQDAKLIYVSNAEGAPAQKDGKGSIAQVSLDGKLVNADWVTGLDAPLGLALHNGRLYAADIDQLVEIDVKTGKVVHRYAAGGAKFLNDVAAAADGTIYVSDMLTDTIWRLSAGTFEPWLQSADLMFPNGVTVRGGKLFVAAWGTINGENFATSVPGHVLEVSISDKSIKPLGNAAPIGNLDGIEATGKSSFLLSDWVAGVLYTFDATSGTATKLLTLNKGMADIGYSDASPGIVYIPLMNDNKLRAYKIN